VRRRAHLALVGIAIAAGARVARADCPNPASAGGYAGYGYPDGAPYVFETAEVRVHVPAASTGAGAEALATEVAQTATVALDAYRRWGFPAPLPDRACADGDADDRLDLYLVPFGAADGLTVPVACMGAGAAGRCGARILIDSQLARRYRSLDEGLRTVVPHEIFHAVQAAMVSSLPRFFAEGTAQWATARLHPDLGDFDRAVPAYFADADSALDAPSGGVTAGFLYGTAVWPRFLERYGDGTVRRVLEGFGAGKGHDDAVGAAIAPIRLAEAFPEFAATTFTFTAVTPPTEPLPASGVLAGLAFRGHRWPGGGRVAFSGDARLAPLHVAADGTITALAALPPAPAPTPPGVIVVAGTDSSKLDARYALDAVPTPPVPETAPDPATPSASEASQGCAVEPLGTVPVPPLLGVVAMFLLRRFFRRRSAGPRSANALALVLALGLAVAGCRRAPERTESQPASEPPARVVAIGGAVTETLFAVGAGDRVVAVDSSSIFPEAATKLPSVGYQRQLAAEGILALHPTQVFASAEAGPPAVLDQLRAAGVPIASFPAATSAAEARARIVAVAAAVDRDPQAILRDFDAGLARVAAGDGERCRAQKVLVAYSRGPGQVLAFGTHTAADGLVALVHAENAIAFEGSRPLTPEAFAAAAPALIVFPTRGLDALGGVDGALKVPGLAASPAGKSKNIVAIDDALLLGFGPRTPAGAEALAAALCPPRK
jgi:iron complex transport system substrate-binding protein